MARIAGVNIPTQKKLGVALTYVYGIGDKISKDVCSQANVDANTRVQDLSESEIKNVTWNENVTPSDIPTDENIIKKCEELQAEYDSKQYQRDRAVAYDPIEEQLDQIYHDIDGWKAKIKSVKDKYPKP